MDRDNQNQVRPDAAAAGQRAPIVDESPSMRRRQIATILGGGATGFAIGAAIVLLVDRSRSSGDAGDLQVWLLGLPLLLSIPGLVIGWVLAGMRNVDDVDAPVRLRRFARRGRAATSVDGQLPGSDVPPHVAPLGEPETDMPVDPTASPPQVQAPPEAR